jgi:hypothetical protein
MKRMVVSGCPEIFTTAENWRPILVFVFFFQEKTDFAAPSPISGHEMLSCICLLSIRVFVHWSWFVVLTSARHGNYMKLHD